MDGEYDFHFERDGQVLSALEVHEAARRDGGRGIVKVQGPDRTVVPMKGLGFPFTSVIGYWWTVLSRSAEHVHAAERQRKPAGDLRQRGVSPDHLASQAGRQRAAQALGV